MAAPKKKKSLKDKIAEKEAAKQREVEERQRLVSHSLASDARSLYQSQDLTCGMDELLFHITFPGEHLIQNVRLSERKPNISETM